MMGAVNNLYKKEKLNNIEELIVKVSNYAWEEMSLQKQGEMREQAAVELAALLAAGNAMADVLKDVCSPEEWDVKMRAALAAWEQVTK
jgi:hypothetical protein